MTQEHWDYAPKSSSSLPGSRDRFRAGLILVDTKYEMGIDEDGVITLIDEIHTRIRAVIGLERYQSRMDQGLDQKTRKEFLAFSSKNIAILTTTKPYRPLPTNWSWISADIFIYLKKSPVKFKFPEIESSIDDQIKQTSNNT